MVGIGTSAGGFKALQALFDVLPIALGTAFVVIVHLDPDTRGELPAIPSAHSNFEVELVTSKTALEADHVYVIPPDRQLRISGHEITAGW